MQLVTWPFLVSTSFSEVGWGALGAIPIVRKPYELLASTGNIHCWTSPLPLLGRWILGVSFSTEVTQAFSLSNLGSTPWKSLMFLAFTSWDFKNFSSSAERTKEKTTSSDSCATPQWPSWSGTNVAKLLWLRAVHLTSHEIFWLRRDYYPKHRPLQI